MPTDLKKFEENRKRNIRKTIRFTDKEFKAVQEKMQIAKITSLNDYLVQVGRNGFILIQDFENLIELSQEVNKIGVNINQIAHRINAENIIFRDDINRVIKMVGNIEQLIFETFNKANKDMK